MIDADSIAVLIREALPDAEVIVRGDDGVHFEAVVISTSFEGMSRVKQHQTVFRALGDRVQTAEIHALALRTFTPERWQQQQ